MIWFIPVVVAAGAGLLGFLFGEKVKSDELDAKARQEYYKCIQTLVKTWRLSPQRAEFYCSYKSPDISIGKVFILSASLISIGLVLYSLSKRHELKLSREVKNVS